MGAFYLDSLMIIRKECMLQTKVNLIAHCAREIDGGFRDVFAPEKLKLEKESTLPGKDNGHYASILVALGFSNEAITNKWIAIAGQFHKLAHRHGAWLKPSWQRTRTGAINMLPRYSYSQSTPFELYPCGLIIAL